MHAAPTFFVSMQIYVFSNLDPMYARRTTGMFSKFLVPFNAIKIIYTNIIIFLSNP